MTTLISWAGVDQRGVASLYLAADSRITWPQATTWDYGRKLFIARTKPHLLGFCGDAFFPTQLLAQVVDLIDEGLLFPPNSTADDCFARLVTRVVESLGQYPESAHSGFDLLHAMREAESMSSRFFLHEARFHGRSAPRTRSIKMPANSGVLAALGSGATSFHEALSAWGRSDAGGTSRAVFSALADAIRAGRDPGTGGPPQLIGLHRTGPGKPFGIVWEARRWLLGMEVKDGVPLNAVRWHNDLFEVADPAALRRLAGSQPQPRPRNVR